MKIVVLGATGNVGSRVTKQAAEAGHEVIAYARRPEAVPAQPHVTTIGGTLEDTAAMTAAMQGADALLVAVTGKMTDGTFMQTHMPAILEAARQAGVKHIVNVSVIGTGDTARKGSLVARALYATLMRKFLADRAVSDRMVEQSDLPWTTAYLVNLKASNALPEGATVKPMDHVVKVPGVPTLPMDDAAAALVDMLTDPATIGQRLLVTTPKGWSATA